MSESADMVKVAWEDIKYPKRWVHNPAKRTSVDRYGNEVSDLDMARRTDHALSMLQMQQSNIITRREAMERMVFE